MRCERCNGEGITYAYYVCDECSGVGIISCCEGTSRDFATYSLSAGVVDMVLTVKQTKSEANYTPKANDPKERCGLCKHFEAPSECHKVVGIVNTNGWCRLFVRDIGAK